MDYISRNGKVPLEDQFGNIYQGKEELKDIKDIWSGLQIPETGERRKEAFNVIFSMPPGTEREGVKNAVRNLAAAHFSSHHYVFAFHDDEAHPHVHVCIKASDYDGIRLNPRKQDLQTWRELFVEKLQDQGIEANATPRWVRGIVQKAEKQKLIHLNKGFEKGQRKMPAQIKTLELEQARQEIESGVGHSNPQKEKIIKSRKLALNLYGGMAKEFLKGEGADKRTALAITNFVKAMPPIKSKHEETVEIIKARSQSDRKLAHEQDQDRGR